MRVIRYYDIAYAKICVHCMTNVWLSAIQLTTSKNIVDNCCPMDVVNCLTL